MNNILFRSIVCAAIALVSISGSVVQGMYSIDAHHWGLMLSNAKDLCDGKLPYKYIFIQYGIFTTFIHAVAYRILGGNLISIIAMTAAAYALGLVLIFRLSYSFSKNSIIPMYAIITCFLFHPIAIYPWSNYIAFPFIVFGIMMLVDSELTNVKLVIGGASLGLAILSREGLAPAVIMLLIGFLVVDMLDNKFNAKNTLNNSMFQLIGMALPILLFEIYLYHNNLNSYWTNLSYNLPRLYTMQLMPRGIGFAGLRFVWHMLRAGALLDFRWMLYAIMLATNLYIIIYYALNHKNCYISDRVVKISIASIVFVTASIHLPELFRLATGSVIGIIPLYILLEHYRREKYFFYCVACALGLTVVWFNSGNYYLPKMSTINAAIYQPKAGHLGVSFWPESVKRYYYNIEFGHIHEFRPSVDKAGSNITSDPRVFRGQRWPKHISLYYQQIGSDLKYIKNTFPNIKYHYNYTPDSFLQVLSPFDQYQLAPFFTPTEMNSLRPDLDLQNKLSIHDDILLFIKVSDSDLKSFKVPQGFCLFKFYSAPPEITYKHIPDFPGGNLLILIPMAKSAA